MASKNDYFKKVGRATATTLSSPGYTTGDTSINIGATTNWPTDTGVTFAIDEVGSDGLRKSGTYNVFNGKVSGAGQVSEVEYVGGDPNRNYSAGATTRVYILVSAYRDNKFTDGILVQHDQDGTHKDITADSITTGPISVTENIDVVDGKSIRDGNDNELITFSQTASAVNEITVKNAATGNAPQIQATGGDTNIDLNLVPKGAGVVKIGGVDASAPLSEWKTWTPTLTGFSSNPTNTTYRYRVTGKTVDISIQQGVTGTSNASTFTISLPPGLTSKTVAAHRWFGSGQRIDNGSVAAGILLVESNATVITCYPAFAGGTWTASGTKSMVFGNVTYEIA